MSLDTMLAAQVFSSASDFPCLISSIISLKVATNRTSVRGAMVVYGLVGETLGICWMHAVNKKNRLAYLLNCSVLRICGGQQKHVQHQFFLSVFSEIEERLT